MLCSYPSESIVRELIPLHSMQAKVLDQSFPNVVDWWWGGAGGGGGSLGRMTKNCMKNTKYGFFGQNIVDGGGWVMSKPIFWVVAGIPQTFTH